MRKMLLIAGMMISLVGCGFIAQKVDIKPDLMIAKSQVGAGKKIYFVVKDERPDTGIGYRGTAYGNGAKITSETDVKSVFQDEIGKGFESMGFVLVNSESEANSKVLVEIRLLEYSTSTGFWTGGVQTKAALKLVAHNASGQEFEQLYRVDNEKRVVLNPTMEENQKLINDTATQALVKLFQDNKLFDFLAK